MIVCGWCGELTRPGRCGNCQRDPAEPWVQRALTPPSQAEHEAAERRRRMAGAKASLEASGRPVTNANLAEVLGIDPRTVGRWMSAK